MAGHGMVWLCGPTGLLLVGRDLDGSVLLGGGWQRVLGLRGRGFLVRLLRGFLVRLLGVGGVVGPALGASFGVMAL